MSSYPREPVHWANEADRRSWRAAKDWYEANVTHLSPASRRTFITNIRYLKLTNNTCRPCTHNFGKNIRKTANWIYIPLMHFLWKDKWSHVQHTSTLNYLKKMRPELPLDDINAIAAVNATSERRDLYVDIKTMELIIDGESKGPVPVVQSTETAIQATPAKPETPEESAIPQESVIPAQLVVSAQLASQPAVQPVAQPAISYPPAPAELIRVKQEQVVNTIEGNVDIPRVAYQDMCDIMKEFHDNSQVRFREAMQQRDEVVHIVGRFRGHREQMDVLLEGMEHTAEGLMKAAMDINGDTQRLGRMMEWMRDAGSG